MSNTYHLKFSYQFYTLDASKTIHSISDMLFSVQTAPCEMWLELQWLVYWSIGQLTEKNTFKEL